MYLTHPPAPGARALIRDEEWLIMSSDASGTGGYQVSCLGLSETVRDRGALFLTALEDITVLDPAQTELVHDDSAQFVATRLLVEARLRRATATGQELVLGHRGVMDPLPFQLEPAQTLLQELRPRLLIADSVGLGKTLEAGILAAELARRGRARRILVVATKSMMKQLQGEFWNRFTIALTRLDSAGIARIRRDIPANHNPFHYYDRAIISIDTLKRDSEYRHFVESAWWDLIIIDEAHNASYKGNRTQNNKLATLLAHRSDALILLTATPHNGRKESFASLMRMLDPTVLPEGADYTRQDVEHLFVRRMKKDVRDQIRGEFPDREVREFKADASPEEDRAYTHLAALKLASDAGRPRDGGMLFKTTLEKSLFSSPPACLETLKHRIHNLEKKNPANADLHALRELEKLVQQVGPTQFSKYQKLLAVLRASGPWQWTGQDPQDRLVIFTERIATLNFLEQHLPAALGLKAGAVAKVHGALPDVELQETVESFGQANSPLRLLLASDVASEGLNLHFQAHRLLHFDIPWSLMVFQQRNGRVDRYGQARKPLVGYFMTQPRDESVRGDLRILEILIQKDTQAAKNIGDPSSFLGVYDQDQEEQKVAGAIEAGLSGPQFEADVLAAAADPLDLLFGTPPAAVTSVPKAAAQHRPITANLPAVFPDDYAYARAAVLFLRQQNPASLPEVSFTDSAQTLTFQPDAALHRMLDRELSAEMWPENNEFALSANTGLVQAAIAEARNGATWPQVQYLWPLHPFMSWLDYKLLAHFGRQKAPVARVARGLERGASIVLILAQVPNRRGQPMLTQWWGVPLDAQGRAQPPMELEEVLQLTGFGEPVVNDGTAPDVSNLQSGVPLAIDLARAAMKPIQRAFAGHCKARLEVEKQKLTEYRHRYNAQLSLEFGRELQSQLTEKQQQRKLGIDKLFEDSQKWAQQTLELDDRAQFTVVAVLVG